MNSELQQRIAAIKAECIRVVELSENATVGPWKNHLNWVTRGPQSVAKTLLKSKEYDASFIAHARNVSPAMARVVVAALECLERQVNEPDWNSHMCDNDGLGCRACELADEFLESIANQWEVK